ncbi:hypothetical protein NV379_23855 [Paenibacillus sp. N1-5-1-14]|uniref:hypothetical protein n=1 Tax=Paenibacillus radicibacter TaxID=2972488 RepID=UPI002158A63D|nr:hypothetical protein [Paenibacillus radicibacter]MCR8645680.1 hypothetical protein [Paenibacillus radicibacter]
MINFSNLDNSAITSLLDQIDTKDSDKAAAKQESELLPKVKKTSSKKTKTPTIDELLYGYKKNNRLDELGPLF